MKIYVASKFGNKEEVRRVQALLRAAGHEVTYDWTGDAAPEIAGACNEFMIPIDEDIARELARRDERGVAGADALIFIATKEGGRGCYTEMGIAIALRIPVIVLGPHVNSIFMYASNVVRFDGSAEDLVAQLADLVEALLQDVLDDLVAQELPEVRERLKLNAAVNRILSESSDQREGLRQAVIAIIAQQGMQAKISVELEASVLHDLFVDLSRARALQREAEDQAARAISATAGAEKAAL